MRVDDFCYFLAKGLIRYLYEERSREQIYNKDKMKMAFQRNISLVANSERQKLVFKALHSSRKYIKMIFRNMWLLPHFHLISARHWSVLTNIIRERPYEWSKVQTYNQWEKHLIYLFTPDQKVINNNPV